MLGMYLVPRILQVQILYSADSIIKKQPRSMLFAFVFNFSLLSSQIDQLDINCSLQTYKSGISFYKIICVTNCLLWGLTTDIDISMFYTFACSCKSKKIFKLLGVFEVIIHDEIIPVYRLRGFIVKYHIVKVLTN